MSDAAPSPLPRGLVHFLFAGLCLWAVGVLCSEPLATAGMIAIAVGGAAEAVRRRGLPVRAIARRWWPLCLFVAWALLGPLLAGRPPSGTGVGRLSDWALIPVAAWAAASISPRQRAVLAALVGGVFLLSCAAAGLQHFGAWPAEAWFQPLVWTRLPFHRVYEEVPGDPARFMGGGLIFHRLKFAHVGGLVVIGAAVAGIAGRGRVRVAGLTVAAVGFASILVFPYARAAAVALAGGLVVAVALAVPQRRWGLVAGASILAAAIIVIVAIAPLRARFISGITASGSGDRDLLLESGVHAVEAHPLVGVGLGRFRPSLFAPPGAPEHVLEQPGKAHNEFLSMAAELGVPGGLLFVLLLVWLARQLNAPRPEAAAGEGVLAYFALLSQVHDPLFQAPFSMGLCLALSFGLMRRPPAGT